MTASQIEARVLDEANYIIKSKATVRAAAQELHVSKSTVYMDMTSRLPYLDMSLYSKVRDVLDSNKDERNVRGGHATRARWAAIKASSHAR